MTHDLIRSIKHLITLAHHSRKYLVNISSYLSNNKQYLPISFSILYMTSYLLTVYLNYIADSFLVLLCYKELKTMTENNKKENCQVFPKKRKREKNKAYSGIIYYNHNSHIILSIVWFILQ